MAKIFLSYSRADLSRIEPLAKRLKETGHDVWWDRRLKGGSEFDMVIEQALAAAEFVVVGWSEAASRSAWVRDEAAAGRDRQCLIPVTLDGSLPPLGFRQFHTIDLTGWNGRATATEFVALIDALAGSPPGELSSTVKRKPSARVRPGPMKLFTLLALIAAVAGLGWWWISRTAPSSTVAVEAGDSSAPSRDLSNYLVSQLGNLQPAGSGAFQLTSDKKDADFVLRVSAIDTPESIRRDISILSAGAILWSASTGKFDPSGVDDLAQDLPRFAGHMLACAVEGRSAGLALPTLKLFLRGCSQVENNLGYPIGNYDTPAVKTFEQVVREAPEFERGWARLLLAQKGGQDEARKALISEMDKRGIRPAELFAVKASLLSEQDFLGRLRLLDAGVAEHPDNANLFERRSAELGKVGRMKDALADASRLLQLDPLSLGSQQSYLFALANAGRIDEARRQIADRHQRWPKATMNNSEIYNFETFYGDPKKARAMTASEYLFPSWETEDFIRTRIDPSPGNVNHAVDNARAHLTDDPTKARHLLNVLALFGRNDEAIRFMLGYAAPDELISSDLFGPAMQNIWRDRRTLAVAARLGLLNYWQKSGQWPDFCYDPALGWDCRVEARKFGKNPADDQ